MARSQLFLRLATECPVDKRVEFEAFVEAAIVFARAAVHRLQTQYKGHPQWSGWWDDLRENPSVRFFRAERDWLLKEAPPKFGQRGFAASISSSKPTHVPSGAAEFYFFQGLDVSAVETVALHLHEVERALKAAEAMFV